MRTLAVMVALWGCSTTQAPTTTTTTTTATTTAAATAATTARPARPHIEPLPAGPIPVPAEPQCPAGTESRSFFCDGEAEPAPAVGYPPPYDRCRTSPLFSQRETDARRAQGQRACCQLRCRTPPPVVPTRSEFGY